MEDDMFLALAAFGVAKGAGAIVGKAASASPSNPQVEALMQTRKIETGAANINRVIKIADGSETFVHGTGRHSNPSGAVAHIAYNQKLTHSVGARASWGEGAYGFLENQMPAIRGSNLVRFRLPQGTAYETISFTKNGEARIYVRMLGNQTEGAIPIRVSQVFPEDHDMFEQILNFISTKN